MSSPPKLGDCWLIELDPKNTVTEGGPDLTEYAAFTGRIKTWDPDHDVYLVEPVGTSQFKENSLIEVYESELICPVAGPEARRQDENASE